MSAIYLDHNATTPLLPEVWDAMRPLMTETFGNPSSAHAIGRKARQALEDAREKIAGLLGAHPDEVTFTSGATEANNLAIFGLMGRGGEQRQPAPPSPLPKGKGEKENPSPTPPLNGEGLNTAEDSAPPSFLEKGGEGLGCLYASRLEHPCVVEPLRHLESLGVSVEWLPANARGVIESGAIAARTGSLVCVMLANHETGAIQPVREIALSLPKGARLHCDAVQAVGKMPVNFHALGTTTLTASAHKFGGPKGVGVLLTKRGTTLTPLTYGGHQQQGRRPGTEPVALAVGMAVALELATRNMDRNRAKLESHRARLWNALERACPPVVLNGPEIGAFDVVPTTLNLSFPGCRSDLLLMALDLAAIACATGSACSSGSLLPSPVLRAMGVSDEVLKSALRFSFAPAQTSEEIDEAAARIAKCVLAMRA
ncbi:cysteine desulfurase family protein [Gemmata palustris]|nr:cysteine desulfurase family protein [Gemmata palustris]